MLVQPQADRDQSLELLTREAFMLNTTELSDKSLSAASFCFCGNSFANGVVYQSSIHDTVLSLTLEYIGLSDTSLSSNIINHFSVALVCQSRSCYPTTPLKTCSEREVISALNAAVGTAYVPVPTILPEWQAAPSAKGCHTTAPKLHSETVAIHCTQVRHLQDKLHCLREHV